MLDLRDSGSQPLEITAGANVLFRLMIPVEVNTDLGEESPAKMVVTVSFRSGVGRFQKAKVPRFASITSIYMKYVLASIGYQFCILQMLCIELTNDEDLLFMHMLHISEDDFQTLKADQGIVVDFISFPAKIAGLMEKCAQAYSNQSERWGPNILIWSSK